MNKRPLLFVPADEFFVELCGLIGEDAGHDLDARFTQTLKAFARYEWVWILDRANNAFDAGVYESFGAGRRFAVMAVRFERDVCSSATGSFSGLFDG